MAFNNYSQHPLHRDGSCWASSTIILALAINGKDAEHSFFFAQANCTIEHWIDRDKSFYYILINNDFNLIRVRFDNKKEAFLKYLTVEFQS
ncbi:hypothetical protein T09_13323 [Trichinella sp. T9]|nr:hypothetical protein T09_13323 [Trichinella sp. T9]